MNHIEINSNRTLPDRRMSTHNDGCEISPEGLRFRIRDQGEWEREQEFPGRALEERKKR